MTPLVFALFSFIQAIGIVIYVERGTNHLSGFIQTFVDNDYTRRFDPKLKGNAFATLSESLNEMIGSYAQLRIEKEEQYQYVKQINEHVEVALISFKEDGKIDLMNKSAQALLDSPFLYDIEGIRNHAEDIYKVLIAFTDSGRKLFKNDRYELAIVAKKFKLSGQSYTLVALQDISQELQANELDAWQKLIRVLTHEIMNSVTPLVSLTEAMKVILESGDNNSTRQLSQEEQSDLLRSLNAIERRGEGLLSFVQAYREYTRLPTPELEQVNLKSLLSDVLHLAKPITGRIKVSLSDRITENVVISMDESLVGQVILNLIKNAAEALEGTDQPKIEVNYKLTETSHQITISDNGPGIPEELRNEIFVPFFTTKKKGSGIGLSLSRQIMKAHGGDISAEWAKDTGTTFAIKLPKVTR